MTRARAQALVLINWKGVFYEHYHLDAGVTALEGLNGAGKTTVLIAAYLVLLPDLARLRFTNLGETAATGGDRGIHGRLGEPGRPSYAIMEIRLPRGKRLLAGVHVERRAEPSVELTPFVVTGLPSDVPLEDVLLDRRDERDEVPDLPRLRELLSLQGAHVKVCDGPKEYLGELFDLGVTPMRMAGDEERARFNDMLRTSLVGGISKALTGGLRSFLLREDTGLASTLKKMRSNLDSCRRTRQQVTEAARLERDIRGAFEAGQAMFSAALHATREREREARQRWDAACDALALAETDLATVTDVLEEARQRHADARARRESIRAELGEAREDLERTRQANVLLHRVRGLERDLARLEMREAADRVRVDAATAGRDAARGRHDQAQSDHDAAAQGLADFRKGLENLERRAHEHDAVCQAVAGAREALPGRTWTPDQAAGLREEAERRRDSLDGQIVRLEREVATVERRRAELTRALAALAELLGEGVAAEEAWPRARQALEELRGLEMKAVRESDLAASLEATRQRAREQGEARARASRLSAAGLTGAGESVQVALDALGRSVATLPEEPRRHEEQALAAWLAGTAPLATVESVRAALDGADHCAAHLHDERRRVEAEAVAARERRARLAERIACLEQAQRARADYGLRVDRLSVRRHVPLATRSHLQALQAVLLEHRAELDRERQVAVAQRDAAVEEAHHLEHSGGTFPESLLAARDCVEGELLAGRFEETPVGDAARVQALLGPLAEAIVVEDVREAARRLSESAHRPDTVWLVGGEAGLSFGRGDVPEGQGFGSDVLVPSTMGWRLARPPQHPTLGRKARAARVQALRAVESEHSQRVVSLAGHLRDLGADLAEVSDLLPEIGILEAPDPALELEESRAEEARLAQVAAAASMRQAVRALDERLAAVATLRKGLTDLLPRATLLDLPDQAVEVARLAEELAEARTARERVAAARGARKLVEEATEVLREPPPSEDALARKVTERVAAERERDGTAGLVRDLRYVEEHGAALAWTDARRVLAEQKGLAPALQGELERAALEQRAARDRLQVAEEARAEADGSWRQVGAELHGVCKELERQRGHLADLECPDADDGALRACEREVARLVTEDASVERQDNALLQESARLEERHRSQREATEARRSEAEAAEAAWRPDHERWERLREQTEEAGVLAASLHRRVAEEFEGASSVSLWTSASERRRKLFERLEEAEDGGEMARRARHVFGEESDQQAGEVYLECWTAVRDWLRRRVPAHVSEVADPMQALEEMREHLARLQDGLQDQERRLRGDSANVARHIDTQVRKAYGQVAKLNGDLGRTRFGSITSVRIRWSRVERMQQVLEALRGGAAQQLLFESDLPLEEAMAELFRRHGGGRDGGDRLLDYREYIKLQVEVQRGGRSDWEEANPIRMSTGEAIGVGAAVMMVILAAWERDAKLFRGSSSTGTLRLLFLDEATRLSQDNLRVLFDLCRNLELQLLIAAPEVARGEGTTTYRLVRRVSEQGREEVLVTGRRFAATALVAESDATQSPEEPERVV